MSTKLKIAMSKLVEDLSLEQIYSPRPAQELFIHTVDVNRPGIQLAGFFDVFDRTRIQILGKTEMAYLERLEPPVVYERINSLFSLSPPMVVVTRSLPVLPVILAAAERYEVPFFRTKEQTSSFMASLISTLKIELAPRITRHGVLMEIYGDGVLILGESGVGKSETALELIVRGHRLIADDAVEIRRVSDHSLVGSAPENIRHFMELRGIGVINARRMFGMASVKLAEKIALILRIEPWQENKMYMRLGDEDEYMEILGVRVPTLTIPVRPGRNLAVIIEAATMNMRMKAMGYDPARELLKRLGLPDDREEKPPQVIEYNFWDIQ